MAGDRVEEDALDAFRRLHGSGPGQPVLFLIAALDEEPSVAAVVRSLPASVAGLPTECVVIDDGSTDGTADRAAEAGAMVCRLDRNVGQGRALRAGYRLAAERGTTVVVTLDADGQFDASESHRLVGPIADGRVDMVNGSRRLGRSEASDPVRRAGVAFYGAVLSALTGARITDPANGFRAFRPAVPATVPLRQAQYQTAELLIGALAAGFRVTEVPVTVRRRAAGESKKGRNLVYGLRFGRVVLTTWWSSRRLSASREPAGTPHPAPAAPDPRDG